MQRITIPEIKKHPWFLYNLPIEFMNEGTSGMEELESDCVNNEEEEASQSIEEILSIIQEARKPGEGPNNNDNGDKLGGYFVDGSMDLDDIDADADIDDVETSGDFVCAI